MKPQNKAQFEPSTRPRREKQAGKPGQGIVYGKDGPKAIRSRGQRWNDEAEQAFLDVLATTCNVTEAAAKAGFSPAALYSRRRNDPAFAQLWQAALEQGYTRIEALLVRRAEDALEGRMPDPESPIPTLDVKDALQILGHHRRSVEGGPRSRRQWARPRSLEELNESILSKLEALVPKAPKRKPKPA